MQPESFISTTANGDGLEFDKRLGNIFDEIEAIKSLKTAEDSPHQGPLHYLREDDELTSDDVASSSLNPLFVLLEAMENLELIKSEHQRASDSE